MAFVYILINWNVPWNLLKIEKWIGALEVYYHMLVDSVQPLKPLYGWLKNILKL